MTVRLIRPFFLPWRPKQRCSHEYVYYSAVGVTLRSNIEILGRSFAPSLRSIKSILSRRFGRGDHFPLRREVDRRISRHGLHAIENRFVDAGALRDGSRLPIRDVVAKA